MIISRSVLLKMRNVSDKVIGKIKTRILYSTTFLRKSFRLGDSVENKVKSDTSQMKIYYSACVLQAR